MSIIKDILKPVISLTMVTFRILPIKKNKIVFSSFSGRSYSDNPKYILEEIIRESDDYDCVIVLNNINEEIPDKARCVKNKSLRYLYELTTAHIWIDNTRKQPYILKRKNQIYIQTWHGCPWIKKIEKDAEAMLDKEYVKTAINDSNNIDILLTNSEWGENAFRKCFWYNGNILRVGSPRLYPLFNSSDKQIKTIREKNYLKSEYKYIMYAPTFRKDGSTDAYNINFKKIITAFQTKFGGKWGIMLRLHPNISEKQILIDDVNDFEVIDVTKYPDINELYIIADALITDYSSSIFDFSITQKPAFIYTSDLEKYTKERDMAMDITNLPYPFAENNDDLVRNILFFDNKCYLKRLAAFHNKLGMIEDGKACKRVYDLIEKEIRTLG